LSFIRKKNEKEVLFIKYITHPQTKKKKEKNMASIASNVLQSQPINTTTGTEIVGKKLTNTRIIPMSVDKINSLTCAREQ
tara:strand:- start:198 stop:437 length:240 start_codon:yes stop_codon:yes gene_type:complete